MRRRSRSSPPGATVASTAELPCPATPTVAACCVPPLATVFLLPGRARAADAVAHSRPDNQLLALQHGRPTGISRPTLQGSQHDADALPLERPGLASCSGQAKRRWEGAVR